MLRREVNAMTEQTVQLPIVRSDLIITNKKERGTRLWIVYDPKSGRTFQLGPEEWFVFSKLNGQIGFAELQQIFKAETGKDLSIATISKFIRQLERAGLLVGSRATTPKQSLFALRLLRFQPGRLFEKTLKFIKPVLVPSMVFCVFLIFIGIIASFINGLDLFHYWWNRRWTLLPFWYLALLYMVVLTGVIGLHEVAHGLVYTYFGGWVREVGFMLLCFLPAVYCDVSGVWLLSHRYQRICVTIAGPIANAVTAAIAIVSWPFLSHSFLKDSAAMIFVTSISSIVVNLFPWLRTDGYYLLSDIIGIPNLEQKSLRALEMAIFRILGKQIPNANIQTSLFLIINGVMIILTRLAIPCLVITLLFFWLLR